MFSHWRIDLKLGVGILLLALISGFLSIGGLDGTSYMFACLLESRWSEADPKTKIEMESYLHLYTTKQIHPTNSGWGSHYELKNGERMIQYMILFRSPLDVVYDSNDFVKAIFTSYE